MTGAGALVTGFGAVTVLRLGPAGGGACRAVVGSAGAGGALAATSPGLRVRPVGIGTSVGSAWICGGLTSTDMATGAESVDVGVALAAGLLL